MSNYYPYDVVRLNLHSYMRPKHHIYVVQMAIKLSPILFDQVHANIRYYYLLNFLYFRTLHKIYLEFQQYYCDIITAYTVSRLEY